MKYFQNIARNQAVAQVFLWNNFSGKLNRIIKKKSVMKSFVSNAESFPSNFRYADIHFYCLLE